MNNYLLKQATEMKAMEETFLMAANRDMRLHRFNAAAINLKNANYCCKTGEDLLDLHWKRRQETKGATHA